MNQEKEHIQTKETDLKKLSCSVEQVSYISKIAEEEDTPLNKDSINQIFTNSNAPTIDVNEKKKDLSSIGGDQTSLT